ncbi:MAG: 50S ribosomal protein L24e [Candidatus Helarchaeota archaeon]|nr:50S ribosomal protein L24e [Candidatus Helarchaeota archaeon]
MVKLRNCTFCGKKIELGTGSMYVRRDGSVMYFCSSKCNKSRLKYKRNPRKLKWTKFYQKT